MRPCIPATGSSRRTRPSHARAPTTTSCSSARRRTSWSGSGTRCPPRPSCSLQASRSCPGRTEPPPSRQSAPPPHETGFPVLLKAVAGGGGKGMRRVDDPDGLEDAYAEASAEAEGAFGDGSLYLEKVVSPARHVEIQVLCDAHENVLTLGERECSIQRRHQKLVEESPSPARHRRDSSGDGAVGRACVPGSRVPRRRDLRVPARAGGQAVLHRGQLQAPGRASGLGARHRHRHRPRAGPDRRRGAAPGRRLGAPPRARARGADQRRGPGARIRARAGRGRRGSGRRWGRVSGWIRRSRTGWRSRRTTTR